MSRSKFDAAKLAELVNEESRLNAALRDVSQELNDTYETDKVWDESRVMKYQRLQLRHAQLTRDAEAARRERTSYEQFEPQRARVAGESPLARFLRKGHAGLEADEIKLFAAQGDSSLISGPVEGFSIRLSTPAERRAVRMADDTRTTAAAVLPREIAPRVVDDLAYFGGVAKMAQQFMTANGNEYRVPNLDADTETGEILASDGTDTTEQELGTFGSANFVARTASSKRIPITRELIQDSVFDIEAYAERQAVRRMGRAWNDAFTNNANNGTPVGVRLSATASPDTASATTFTWAEVTALEYLVNRAYREGSEGQDGLNAEMGGVTGYMMSDSAERIARTLLDGDNRPLWLAGASSASMARDAGVAPPNRFNGYPLVVNGALPAVATNVRAVLFGNFSYYGIRTVNTVEIFRFMDSRTMVNNTVECLAFSRRDGRPMGAVSSRICAAIAALVQA